MRKLWSSFLAFLALVSGCGQSDSRQQDTAVAVRKDDKILAAAVERARASITNFTEALAHPKPTQSGFSVKVPIVDDKAIHYMWLQGTTFSGSEFRGTLGADAAELKQHQPGKSIAVPVSQIFDWMYVESNKLVGGFTLRAIRDQLRGEQRSAFEKSLWFEFD